MTPRMDTWLDGALTLVVLVAFVAWLWLAVFN